MQAPARPHRPSEGRPPAHGGGRGGRRGDGAAAAAGMGSPRRRRGGPGRRGRVLPLLLAALLLLLLLGAAPGVRARGGRKILKLVNKARREGATCGEGAGATVYAPGAAPLATDKKLRKAAKAHARDMATNEFFAHTGSDGSSVADRAARYLAECGAWGIAENIAAGYASPKLAFEGWMESPGHCRNIMNPDLEALGYYKKFFPGSPYGFYHVQVFGRCD